jgi:hypothetical protein
VAGALAGAALAAGVVAAATAAACRRAGAAGARVGAVPAVLAGTVAGAWLVGALPRLPPASALARLVAVGLPVAALVELAAPWRRPGIAVSLVRGLAGLALVRVLLHGSVHLGVEETGSRGAVIGAAALAALAWPAVAAGERRDDGGVVTAVAVVLTLAATALAIPLAGFVKGGMVALVLAAALAGSLAGGGRVGLAGFGFAALVGIVGVGRFFGGLPTPAALLLASAPLIACAAGSVGDRLGAAPAGRMTRSVAYRLALAGVPLAVVVFHGYREFERSFRPLLAPPRAAAPVAGSRAGQAPAERHQWWT